MVLSRGKDGKDTNENKVKCSGQGHRRRKRTGENKNSVEKEKTTTRMATTVERQRARKGVERGINSYSIKSQIIHMRKFTL